MTTLPTAVTTPLLRRRSRVAGAALLAVLSCAVGGCGDQAGPAGDSSGTPGRESPGQETGPVDHEVVEMVTTTMGGGEVDERAVDVTGRGGVGTLVAPLEGDLPAQVRAAVRRARQQPDVRSALKDGERLYGAVVAIGCEPPRDVVVEQGDGGLDVRAAGTGKETVQCLAPMTTVAVFTA